MSILHPRDKARHRGLTPHQLRQAVRRLARENDDLACQIVALAAENDRLKTQFDQAAIDYSTVLDDLRIARQERDRALTAVTAWEARWANHNPVHVPAPRDLREDDDRPTVPHGVPVITPVIPITRRTAAADATSPANIPAA